MIVASTRNTELALCTVPAWLTPLSTWMAYQPNLILSFFGWFLMNLCATFWLYFGCGSVLFLAAVPVLLLVFKDRRKLLSQAGWAMVWTASFTAGMILRSPIFRWSIHKIERNSEPLIVAIKQYEAEQGKPPGSLDVLVPDFITTIPSTGIGMFSEFRYVVNEPDHYDGNPWVLIATPPCLMMNFDQMLYFPRQNYPQHGYGGSLERIEKWAYVHE